MIKSLYPCFQHWSEKGSVYLVSDTHFYDNDREYMGYNIPSSVQLERITSICHKNDTLIHLGDVGSPEWMNKVKAYKVLIMGNHDQSIEKMKEYFNEVYSGPLWISQKLVLSHEPIWLEAIESYNQRPIAFNIHGHDHNKNNKETYYSLNLAQNVYGYVPLNLNQFIKSGKLKNIKDIHRVIIDNATERSNLDKANYQNADFSVLWEWYQDTGVENV